MVAATACRKQSAPADGAVNPAQSGSAANATSPSVPPSAPPAPSPPLPPVPKTLPDVLARVNSEDVRKAEFEAALRTIERRNGRPIPEERRDEILRKVLDELVTFTVLKQEAQARGIAVADAEVDARVQELQQSVGGEEGFKKALKDQNMTVERLRSDTRTQLAVGKLLERQVASAPATTDTEAKEFYDKNPDKFTQPEMVRASHILIRVEPNADDATKQKARARIDAILKRAKAGEDFAALAKANSDDGSSQSGGDLDYFPREQMVPEFSAAAFKLKTGEMSDVVTTQFGHHIIKLTDRRPASTVPLEQVNDRIKQVLAEQKKQQLAEAFIAQLRQKSKVEVLI